MFITWLGYLNSTLNPIIYTIFNPYFRQVVHCENLSSNIIIYHYDQPDHLDHLQQFQHVNNNDQDYDLHDQDLNDTTTQTDHFNFL